VGARRGGAHPPTTPRGAPPRAARQLRTEHAHAPRDCSDARSHARTRAHAAPQEAGYDPDISNGLRRLADPDDPEAQLAQAQAQGAAAAGTAAALLGATAEEDDGAEKRAAPPRYGAVLREVTAVAGAAPAGTAAGAHAQSAAAAAVVVSPPPPPPVSAVLRRVFARDHPGVGAMCSWLAEEGVSDAAQLRQLLTPAAAGGASSSSSTSKGKGGAAALRELGFRPEWADAVAAGFARAAAAAEKADAAAAASGAPQ
jgi:hypothetical protein